MQQMQLGIFCAVVIAFKVCGCILTRRPAKGRQISTKSDKASGQRGEAAGVIAEELAPLFPFLSFREWHSTFLAFVDAKCRKRTKCGHVFD